MHFRAAVGADYTLFDIHTFRGYCGSCGSQAFRRCSCVGMTESESSSCDAFCVFLFLQALLIPAPLLAGILFVKWQGAEQRLIDVEQRLIHAEQEIRRLRLQLDLLVN